MTEASIHGNLKRDLFAAMGEPLEKTANGSANVEGAWSVRLYHKPFVRWIWLGAVLMALGGLLAATDKRYRLAGAKSKSKKPLPPVQPPASAQVARVATSDASGTS